MACDDLNDTGVVFVVVVVHELCECHGVASILHNGGAISVNE